MKTRIVGTAEEAHRLGNQLADSAERTVENLRQLVTSENAPLTVLARLKFEEYGCDPLDPERPLNLIEQLNQSLTYQATFPAAAWPIETHPEHAPLTVNMGTSSGNDIVSHDGQLVAEVFAAVDPRNNRKRESDIARLSSHSARLKYVLYLSPTTAGKPEHYDVGDVQVRRLAENPE